MRRADIDAYFKKVELDLTSKLSESESLLTQINEALLESTQNRKESSEVLSSINKNYQQVVDLIAQIKTDLSTVADLRTRALDPQTGIEIIIKKAQIVADKANKISTEIDEIRKSVDSNRADIKKLLDASLKDRERIGVNATTADEILNKINEIYQLAADTGLAGSFDKRTKELEPFVKGWRMRFSVSLGALTTVLAAVLIITFFIDGIKFDGLTIVRLALITPLAVYVGFSAVQYSRERSLLEKYAFKATTALALESYTRLLVEKFDKPKYEKEILSFVLSAMGDIYKEPHEPKKIRNWNIVAGNKIASLKARMTDEFEKIDKRIDKLEEPPSISG